MKIKITMKDPDTMHDAVQNTVIKEVEAIGLSDDEFESIVELRTERVRAKMAKWFEYGEYLTVEFDTETMMATVLDANE